MVGRHGRARLASLRAGARKVACVRLALPPALTAPLAPAARLPGLAGQAAPPREDPAPRCGIARPERRR